MKSRYAIVTVFAMLAFSALCLAALDSKEPAGKKGLEITRITPDGIDVPQGQAIVIQFNKPVVALGRMERKSSEIPVQINPEVKGQWRWLDTSTLALQMNDADSLKPATKYTVTVKPGIKTLEGETLQKDYMHRFITQRPAVTYSFFSQWKSPVKPAIVVFFNQSVTKEAVKNSLVFKSAKNTASKINVVVSKVPDQQADSEIKAAEKTGKVSDAESSWLVEPAVELEKDSSYELYIEKGIVSVEGPEKGEWGNHVVQFDTFPAFRFLGLRYHTITDEESVLIAPEKPGKTDALKADPMQSVFLVFSSPVLKNEIRDNVTFKPDLSEGMKDFDPWEGSEGYSQLDSHHAKGQEYLVRIPVLLKAFQRYDVAEKKKGIRDEFGRRLENQLELAFLTDHRKPEFRQINRNAVLEHGIDTEMPVAVTNLKSLKISGRTLTSTGVKDKVSVAHDIPKVDDIAFFLPAGIRKLLGGKSGVVYGSIESDPKIEKSDNDKYFFTQVTPYHVHAKIGHFNSLVWVTTLSDGKPVQGAEVTIVKNVKNALAYKAPVLAKGITDKDGAAVLPGNEKFDPDLSENRWAYGHDNEKTLFVHVRKGDYMALLPVDAEFELDAWRLSNTWLSTGMSQKYGHIKAWGATPQGIYRAGDTLSYKIYVRNQVNEGSVLPPLKSYSLVVKDPMDNEVYKRKDIVLSGFGAFDGSFKIPEKGAVGWYRFELSADFTKNTWEPVTVLVSDFTPSSFKVENHLSGDMFKNGDTVEINTSARLFAGGPYASASARVVARLEETPFMSKNPVAQAYYFSTAEDDERQNVLYETMENLNEKGDLVRKFKVSETDILYGKIRVESSVRDDRGKSVSSVASADFFGRDRFVGLKSDQWICNQGEPSSFFYIAVNEKGAPLSGIPAKIVAERQVVTAAKVKGAGNAYLTTTNESWVVEHETTGTCSKDGAVYMFVPKHPGSYRITAEIKDSKGRPHKTHIYTWVAGKGVVLWSEPDDYSLTIIPEQKEFKTGDTARYLVKNPFPGAMALVSIERYGVLKHWTQRLETATPVIEFPVLEDYMPGFFVSVTVVSGRVDKAPGEGGVDLGKPTFRSGYVESGVRLPAKVIDVDVKSDMEVYRPGDTVKLSFAASYESAGKKEKVELAVAVIDEAVFSMISGGRSSFDPYKGFNNVDYLDVANYNLLTQLIGRTKFEKKGANPGGDGGMNVSMRSVFDFVSYWNPSVVTDENGRANVSFKVPDSLTGWKVFAMAVNSADRMGLGEGDFKVNRPTEVRPVMPNLVRVGDSFRAGFTVMNRTDAERTLNCKIKVTGPVDNSMKEMESTTKVKCPPYKRVNLWMPVKAVDAGNLQFEVTAGDKKDSDGMKVSVPVIRKSSRETWVTWGTGTEALIKETIEIPEGIKTENGEISVVLSPSVTGGLEGAFGYMKNCPYSSWEHKISRAVAASCYLNLKEWVTGETKWHDAGQTVKEVLEEAEKFQAASGAMAFYVPEDSYINPYLSVYTAIAFNWLKKQGHAIPEKVERKLDKYLEDVLKRDVFPNYYSNGMRSTIRAAALMAMAEKGKLKPADLKRFDSHVPLMDMFGKALFLKAAVDTEGAEQIAVETYRKIMGQASVSAGKYTFSDKKDNSFFRMMSSQIRDDAAVLSAIVAFGDKKYGKNFVGDEPFKLVRSIVQSRQNRAHWANTQENVFCIKAMWDYAKVYESEKTSMSITVSLDKDEIGRTTFGHVKNKSQIMKREITPDDPGKKQTLTITKEGQGRLYYSPGITFEPEKEKEGYTNNGIEIRKEICVERGGKWVGLNPPIALKRGELIRVDLFLNVPSARHFVVVDDAVPGGLEPVNRDLATSSVFDAEKGDYKAVSGSLWFKYTDWIEFSGSFLGFYHRELRHDSVRFYSDYLEPGRYHLSYTAQSIAQGQFVMPPSRAEEMYDPDVNGRCCSGVMLIE